MIQPIFLRDGEGTDGGGSGADILAEITGKLPAGYAIIKEEERKSLTEKSYASGLNDMAGRKQKALEKKIAALGIQPGDDFDSTVDAIIEAYNNKSKPDDEKAQLHDLKVKTLSEQIAQLTKEKEEAYQTRDSYIVDAELSNTFSGKVVDNEMALLAFKNENSVIRKADGTISIKDRSGNRLINPKTGEPATLAEAAEMFLKTKPFLTSIKEKVANIKTPEGAATDDEISRIMAKDPKDMTPADRTKLFESAKGGKLDRFPVYAGQG